MTVANFRQIPQTTQAPAPISPRRIARAGLTRRVEVLGDPGNRVLPRVGLRDMVDGWYELAFGEGRPKVPKWLTRLTWFLWGMAAGAWLTRWEW